MFLEIANLILALAFAEAEKSQHMPFAQLATDARRRKCPGNQSVVTSKMMARFRKS